MMACVHPTASSIAAELSPVKAPSFAQCTFCPPMRTLLPFAASTAAGMQTDGGQTTISSRSCAAMPGKNALKKARVWSGVLYIFQLAAITFFLMSKPILSFLKRLNEQDKYVDPTERNELRGRAARRRQRRRHPACRCYATYFFSVSASTPGSFFPSRNSNDAPPPVEMCVIRSATPASWAAETVSPPQTIDVAPELSTTA